MMMLCGKKQLCLNMELTVLAGVREALMLIGSGVGSLSFQVRKCQVECAF